MKTKKLINVKKMFVLPLTLTIILSIVSGFFAFTIAVTTFEESHVNHGMQITELLSKKITHNLEDKQLMIDNINESLVTVGMVVVENSNSISNEYLAKLAEVSNVDEIYWYDNNGTLLFSSNYDEINGIPINQSIYFFMRSGKDKFIEDFRKGVDGEKNYKYIYLRGLDGYFVSVGVEVDNVLLKLSKYEYQNVINEILQENNDLLYALILDTNFTEIADTDIEDIGLSFPGNDNYLKVITGKTVASKWEYSENNETVLEIATPIYYDHQIVGILGLGYSLDIFNNTKILLASIFAIMTLGFVFFYIFFQMNQVIIPLRRFNIALSRLDVNAESPEIIIQNKGSLSGLYDTLIGLMERIRFSNKRNRVLNREVKNLAYLDYITKLPNRLSFYERLNEQITPENQLAIYFLDLDGFKTYNDTKGHTFGDKLLVSIANKLSELMDENCYVSRYGGDEFLILFKYEDIQEVHEFIRIIHSIFASSFSVEGSLYPMDVSIGISLYPQDGTDCEELIRKADVAMYSVKKLKRKSVEFFNSSMDLYIENHSSVINILKNAIRNDGFDLLYQPQVDIYTNKIVGLEALLRIKNETISPGVFIPIAEQFGLIKTIGKIVKQKAIEQISLWAKEGFDLVPVFVNYSVQQFDDETTNYIKGLLEQYNVSPDLFGIEVTETTILERSTDIIRIIKEMKKIGLKTALDDFGSGQSGLNNLTNFELDLVKLDKSFSDRFLREEMIAIYNTIIRLSKLLGYRIIAEGIETEEQINLLKKTDCKLVQGYYFYKPMAAAEIKKLLISNSNK